MNSKAKRSSIWMKAALLWICPELMDTVPKENDVMESIIGRAKEDSM